MTILEARCVSGKSGGTGQRRPRRFHPEPTVAPLEMVVDEPHRLHERVDRRRPHERPAAPPELLREGARLVRLTQLPQRRARAPPWARRARRLEPPDERGERACLVDELLGPLRVVDRRLDLAAVADDRRVAEEPVDVARPEPRDPPEVEAGEGAPERLALA